MRPYRVPSLPGCRARVPQRAVRRSCPRSASARNAAASLATPPVTRERCGTGEYHEVLCAVTVLRCNTEWNSSWLLQLRGQSSSSKRKPKRPRAEAAESDSGAESNVLSQSATVIPTTVRRRAKQSTVRRLYRRLSVCRSVVPNRQCSGDLCRGCGPAALRLPLLCASARVPRAAA